MSDQHKKIDAEINAEEAKLAKFTTKREELANMLESYDLHETIKERLWATIEKCDDVCRYENELLDYWAKVKALIPVQEALNEADEMLLEFEASQG